MSKPKEERAYITTDKTGTERIPVLEMDLDPLGSTIGIDPKYAIPAGDYIDFTLEVESETSPYRAEWSAFVDCLGGRIVRPGGPDAQKLSMYRLTYWKDYTLPIETIGAETYPPDTSALKPM